MSINMKSSKEQIKLTSSVIKIYQMLANLEKENMVGEEYKNTIDLLIAAVSYERKAYQLDTSFVKNLPRTSLEQKFTTFEESSEILCNIRCLNLTSNEVVYSMEGNLFHENKKDFKDSPMELDPITALFTGSPISNAVRPKKPNETQEIMDEAFFKKIEYVLSKVTITEEERRILIETKYALLATSKTLEKKFLNGDLRDMLLPILSKADKDSLTLNLLSRLGKIEERVFDITDDVFDRENAIAQLLYIDTCIVCMQEVYAGVIAHELVNTIDLNGLFGLLTNTSRNKICDLMNKVFRLGYFRKNNQLEKK